MAQPTRTFQPPREVEIPQHLVTNLELKFNSATNEVHNLRADLERGHITNTMISWNELLQRYSSILGRLADLTAEVNRAAHSRPGVPAKAGPMTSHYLVHPLHALPDMPSGSGRQMEAVNTMPFPGSEGVDEGFRSMATAGLLGKEQLAKLDPSALERHVKSLKERWEGENSRAKGILGDIEALEGEYDWKLRVDAEQVGSDEEDLFGEDGDGDEDMEKDKDNEGEKEAKEPNPREGWTLKDYLTLMDTGRTPVPAAT